MGFLGSLHCAGMCGPIMIILPFHVLTGWKRVLGITFYHLGRITVYAIMGVVLFSFKALFHPQWQQTISLVLGGAMLLFGLFSFISSGSAAWVPQSGFVKKQAARFMGNPSLPALTIAGMLNGMLPCGLVYMALAMAVASPSLQQAILSMYAFGLGTLPMLVSIIVLRRKFSFVQKASFKKYIPLAFFAMGALLLLRGANLGIPYLSPKMEMKGNAVESSCCHP